MFNNNFEFCAEKEIYDDSGNNVILDCTIEDSKYLWPKFRFSNFLLKSTGKDTGDSRWTTGYNCR